MMVTQHLLARGLAALLLTLAAAHAALAAPEYHVTVVGPPDSRANGINQAGVVVGVYPANATFARGFLSRGRGWVDLPAIGVSSAAVAINDKGEVLGNWRSASGQGRGVIWYRGERRDIGTVPGADGTFYRGINNRGFVLGQADLDGVPRTFLRAPNGAFIDIGHLPGEPFITEGLGLNNRNQITGGSGEFVLPEIPFRAFLWQRGTLRDLGDVGSQPNVGNDINDHGQITGFASLPNAFPDRVAFIYAHGRLRSIDNRPASAMPYSIGQGINNLGHVVGFSNHLSGFVYRGRRMESLNALIDPSLGWNIQLPRDINDAGQIAATGARGGQYYAVRLDPIRPNLEMPPVFTPEEEAERAGPAMTPEQAAVEARLDAEAQAREVVHSIRQ